MNELLKSDQKKIDILKILADGKIYSYYHLSKAAKTNYDTVKKNCNFLELLNLIEVNRVEKEESASGSASFMVKITKKGKEFIESIKD